MQVTITINEWVLRDIVGRQKNRSARIEELLVKGYYADKEREARQHDRQPASVEHGILSRFLPKNDLRSFL